MVACWRGRAATIQYGNISRQEKSHLFGDTEKSKKELLELFASSLKFQNPNLGRRGRRCAQAWQFGGRRLSWCFGQRGSGRRSQRRIDLRRRRGWRGKLTSADNLIHL